MTKGKDLFINFKILSLLFFCLILDSLNKLKDQLSTYSYLNEKKSIPMLPVGIGGYGLPGPHRRKNSAA